MPSFAPPHLMVRRQTVGTVRVFVESSASVQVSEANVETYAVILLPFMLQERNCMARFARYCFVLHNRTTRLTMRTSPLKVPDALTKGRDYYDSGPRYNTNYIQCCGLGTVTDSLSTLKTHVFDEQNVTMDTILEAVATNFENDEVLRQTILNRTPFFGNNDDDADDIAVRVYDDLFDAIDGKPSTKEDGKYHLNMLSTTCHIYFGKVLGATPNGRFSGKSISDGTSPSHGADTNGPSAVIKSLTKIDHVKSGGTLLSQRFLPSLLKKDADVAKLGQLIRSYFTLGGHHIQFNVVDTATLRAAQKTPDDYKDLLVRMAGYSDYFNDMNEDLQQEVIERTENESF